MRISVLTPSIRPEGLKVIQESLAQQTLQDFEWLTEISIPERGHDLNAAYNRMLRRAKGELIVSYQDWIKIEPDGLQQFWDAYTENPDTFFTAPVGKTLDWETIVWDWRFVPEAKPDWRAWEIDWACAPLKALKAVGGFDEELDQFWTFDNVNLGCRAEIAGYRFSHLPNNRAVAFDHNKTTPHPFSKNINADFHNYRLNQFRRGVKIDYLR